MRSTAQSPIFHDTESCQVLWIAVGQCGVFVGISVHIHIYVLLNTTVGPAQEAITGCRSWPWTGGLIQAGLDGQHRGGRAAVCLGKFLWGLLRGDRDRFTIDYVFQSRLMIGNYDA